MSRFSWMDFSEHERRRALDVIDLFREEETRDELGLGTIRDAYADMLFPGTSTIQTRVRYFLFIPWLYLSLENSGVPSKKMARRARLAQDQLRRGLMEAGESTGVIGLRAGRDVQRLPSSIYWHGLRRWGIRRFPGSETDYFRSLNAFYRMQASGDYREEKSEEAVVIRANWDPNLPPLPEGFPEEVTFALTPDEADYLADRVATRAPASLLAELINHGFNVEGVSFPWEHPAVTELSTELCERLEHARKFSEIMHGAALLYNLMLSEMRSFQAGTADYLKRLKRWWSLLESRWTQLLEWDRHRFWTIVRSGGATVPLPTQRFVTAWVEHVMASQDLAAVVESQVVRNLIADRERKLKGGRARVDNPSALERWNGASGTAQIDYRWGKPVKAFLEDILVARESEVAHA
jgi:hypothetical protein